MKVQHVTIRAFWSRLTPSRLTPCLYPLLNSIHRNHSSIEPTRTVCVCVSLFGCSSRRAECTTVIANRVPRSREKTPPKEVVPWFFAPSCVYLSRSYFTFARSRTFGSPCSSERSALAYFMMLPGLKLMLWFTLPVGVCVLVSVMVQPSQFGIFEHSVFFVVVFVTCLLLLACSLPLSMQRAWPCIPWAWTMYSSLALVMCKLYPTNRFRKRVFCFRFTVTNPPIACAARDRAAVHLAHGAKQKKDKKRKRSCKKHANRERKYGSVPDRIQNEVRDLGKVFLCCFAFVCVDVVWRPSCDVALSSRCICNVRWWNSANAIMYPTWLGIDLWRWWAMERFEKDRYAVCAANWHWRNVLVREAIINLSRFVCEAEYGLDRQREFDG